MRLVGAKAKLRVEAGPLVEFDDAGVPWRASTDEASPYYFSPGDRQLWVELAGRSVEQMNVFEFDRRNGWVKRDHPATGKEEQVFGRVTARYR